MKGKAAGGWACLVLGIVGSALMGVLILEAQVQPPNAAGAAQPRPYPLGTAQRIQVQVAEVSAESLAESIENLVQPDMYFWPGGASPNKLYLLRFPLMPEEGGEDIGSILSNRRFLRVYDELAALDPNKVTSVLGAAFPLYLEAYRAALKGYLTEREGGFRPREAKPGEFLPGPAFQVGGPSDGRPNPLGERYRLLALVLIAGNLGLEGAHTAVQDVVKQAVADRERFYAEGEFSVGFRHRMLTMSTVYNRQILAHALLRTSPDKARVAQVWTSLGKEMQTKDVPAFDAVRTEADARFMPGPVDFSKGVMRVEYLPPLSDEEFNIVVEALMPKEKPPAP